MATKDKVAVRVAKVRDEMNRTGKVVLRAPALIHICECVMRFLLGAVLAGGELFGGYAPFGVGLVACSGSGMEGFCALLGACFGYLSFYGFIGGLRYVAAAILVFSVSFAFFDLRLYRLAWFMPALSSCMMAVTGFVYLSERGWTVQSTIFFLTEVLLTGASGYFYTIALSTWGKKGRSEHTTHRQRISILILVGTLLLPLAQLTFFRTLSVGHVLAAMAVMVLAYQGGMGAGAIAGVALGVSLDLVAEGGTIYAMAYALSGVMAGIGHRKGKLTCTLTYVLFNGLAVLWMWSTGPHIELLYEVFIASILFMLLPEPLLAKVGEGIKKKDSTPLYAKSSTYVRDKLAATAEGFRTLHQALLTAFTYPAVNDNDAATIFDHAAERVCKSCTLQSQCWHEDYVSTYNALNSALPKMLERGSGEGEDFPQWFSHRCIKFASFLEASNQELTGLRYRRQYESRLLESRQAVCRQYGALAETLGQAVTELEGGLTLEPVATKRLKQYLLSRGMEGESGVYRDEDGRIRIEITTSRMARLSGTEGLNGLSQVVGRPLRLIIEDPPRGDRLLCVEEEPLMAVAGLFSKTKTGEEISGDTGTWFKGEDGTLYVLLCDGMGSGAQAQQESDLAVKLLEKFLRAGVYPEHALKTVAVAMGFRGESQGGFTTVDLMVLNLFTGQGGIYKYGAAPTYIKQGGQVSRLAGGSLPMGISAQGTAPDYIPFQIKEGDCILLASDGLAGGGQDVWIREALGHFDGGSPNELASLLVEESGNRGGEADDRMALVLKLCRKNPKSLGLAKSSKEV